MRTVLTVRPGMRQVLAAKRLLAAVPRGWPKAASRAVNKTAGAARTRIVREIAAETKLTPKYLRKRIWIRRASYTRLEALVRIGGHEMPLIAFRARQTQKGVTYMVVRSRGRQLMAGAFIATMPMGHKGVFKRRGAKRLPIDEQYSQSLQDIYADAPGLARRIIAETSGMLEKNLWTQIHLILEAA